MFFAIIELSIEVWILPCRFVSTSRVLGCRIWLVVEYFMNGIFSFR